ncbi:ankyrin-1-like [Mytilus californianus]|uniref:ankyrin-1-like n=1 Tax=Mytilus californianus TaxID=6549 RepID=UPI002246A6E8|nr:ankyrin-1-like [Mytilus californianus]
MEYTIGIQTKRKKQFERRLEQWKKDDQQFVSTKVEKCVMQNVLTQSSVTIVGNSGIGKSFLSKHIALLMMKHGYTVIPCSKPEDIGKWFKHDRKTLFVYDDVCGRYTLNQQIYNDWKQNLNHITSLLTDQCCKIISTCRLEVYKDECFSNLSFFEMCIIDLSSQEFKLSAAEKNALAEVYFKDNTDEVKELSEKYDFFPLLCSLYHKQNLQKNVSISSFFSNPFDVFKDQVEQMYGESDAGKMQYCSLVLCVMFNNTLTEENLSTQDKKIGAVIENSLRECELNKGTSIKRLKKSLETLEGTYVVKEDSTYKIIHDKLFDFLAKYFGEKMIHIFIDHADTEFIRERFLWKMTDNMGTEIEFVIRIPDKYVNRYIDRLLKDWENGYVYNVCHNRNMNSTLFTETFVTHLNQLDPSKQQELVCTKDIHSKDIALSGSCYIGTIDIVKWLISRNSDINFCRQDGWFPLLWASQEGHINVVKELLQYSSEVNKCDNDGVSPLYKASQNGHVDVVKELIQHSADANKCTNDGISPLQIASNNNMVEVVHVLLQCDDVDINLCDDDGCSSLYWASQEGHVDVVKELLQHSADVNKCTNDGTSPLQMACYNNMVEVVHVLLQLDNVDIDHLDENGCSSLYQASQKGHIDVVKELIQHSADVNKCNKNDASPLHIASQEGHVNVVKELLQHSADVNQCTNDGTSPLQIASNNNRIEVVHVLLQCDDVDINLCDDEGCSSLYLASQEGHVDVVKELLQHSADVNKCTNDGTSPLQMACYNNMVEVVHVLLH